MRIKHAVRIFVLSNFAVLLLLFLSKAVYANFTVAMLSSMFIVMGSLYSYRNMIAQRVEGAEFDDSKDVIDMMDDPYDLYEEERENEVADIKQMIKEEKTRQKSNVIQNTTKNASAWVSLYRLVPYAFLILGFLALNNNHSLLVFPYLLGLAAGIPLGYLIARELFISQSSEH
jgi:1,4-dihydroxy-2-naphthoate octaprenyltransferase